MKSTALNIKCMSAIARVSRGGGRDRVSRAHTPPRHRRESARGAPPALLDGADFPAYVEGVDVVAPHVATGAAGRPRVLHVDTETGTASVLAGLLGAAAHVTHAATLAQARQLLRTEIYSLVILDTNLPDGDARALLPLLSGTPLLVYANERPEWRDVAPPAYLSKSWTNARQLWSSMAGMLWNTSAISAGD